MDNLKFRRQFLISPKKCEQLKDWRSEAYGAYTLYVHPDCELTISAFSEMQIALIGYIIDPYYPHKSNANILEDIAQSGDMGAVCKKLYSYSGRFVLVIRQSGEYTLFHDACGLRSVFYTKYNGEIYIASQPLLFKFLLPLKEGVKYQAYHKSAYIKSLKEHWIPSGSSLYENVFHLVPNHYLKFSSFNQVRYWPDRERHEMSPDDALIKISSLLSATMIAANQRFQLAVTLTAGWDSRVILSACKPIAKDIYFYTLQYRNLIDSSNDIQIPHDILEQLGYQHNVIDCRKPIDKNFAEIYTQNTDIPHLFDWGLIAYGMWPDYPQERVAVKGNCIEIGRCFYYKTGKHETIFSVEDLFSLVTNYKSKWKDVEFVKKQVSEWFEEVKDSKTNKGYDLLDLFYWEHRMGSWQSQSQLEWDIIQEVFTPFNNRALLDTLLQTDPRYRCKPKYIFFRKLIQNLWKEILIAPINPKSLIGQIKDNLKDTLKKFGVLRMLKKMG